MIKSIDYADESRRFQEKIYTAGLFHYLSMSGSGLTVGEINKTHIYDLGFFRYHSRVVRIASAKGVA
jgi:hypothetical protein